MAIQVPFEDRRIFVLSWNSVGNRLAIATADYIDNQGEYVNHLVRVLNIASGEIELSIPFDDYLHIVHVSWCNNDTELVIVNNFGEIRRFDARNGTLLGQWSANGSISALDINPLKTLLALTISRTFPNSVIPTNEEYLEVYDVMTGDIQQNILLSSQVRKSAHWLEWSPDGNRLAITNSRGKLSIYLWNGKSLSFQREIVFAPSLAGHTYGTWGPDSRHIAVTASDISVEGVVIYDTESGIIIHKLDQSLGAFPIAWSVETNLIAAQAGSHRGAWATRVWNGGTGQIVGDIDNSYLTTIAWSSNGTLAIGCELPFAKWQQNPQQLGVTIWQPSSLPTKSRYI